VARLLEHEHAVEQFGEVYVGVGVVGELEDLVGDLCGGKRKGAGVEGEEEMKK
jgi:hypothetical protein